MVSTEAVLNATYLRFNESLSAVEGVANIVWALTLEPLPPALYARHARSNALGLQDRKESLVVVLLTASYTDAADDDTIDGAGKALMEGIEEDARELDATDPFVYLPYAAEYQDPIAGYGVENLRRLRAVAEEVDPTGVFQTQVPGGFKFPQW